MKIPRRMLAPLKPPNSLVSVYTEAWKRGWDRASVRVVMGDGSHWIWNIADQHFHGAIQIVDLYHAREHLWDLARKLCPADEAAQKRWLMHKLDWLENGKIEKLAAALLSWQMPARTLSWLSYPYRSRILR